MNRAKEPTGWKVEGLRYPTPEQADVVAQRFARRYGRDIAVRCVDTDRVIYYITQTGHRIQK